MQAIYRCGHTKEFNDERFHDAQIGHIMNSYAGRDCPICRELAPTCSTIPAAPARLASAEEALKPQGSERIIRQSRPPTKPLTPLEERLIAALNEPFGPAEEDDIFADRTSTGERP